MAHTASVRLWTSSSSVNMPGLDDVAICTFLNPRMAMPYPEASKPTYPKLQAEYKPQARRRPVDSTVEAMYSEVLRAI